VPRRRRAAPVTGPVTRSAALAAGLNDRHLRAPLFERLSRDTYLPLGLVDDIDARVAAVLMTAPPGTVASHASAASLWELEIPLADRSDRRIDLIVPMRGRAESRSDRRIHRLALTSDETTTRRGQPVTTPARTWRDLAGVLTPAALLAVTDQVLGTWCTRADLTRQLGLRPTGRGSARARDVLPVGDARAESPMESVLRWLIHEASLPAPVLQHTIRDPDGAFLGRADLAWPGHKVIVEFDGDVHRERAVFVNDVRRQNRLVAAGWLMLRFTSADVLGRPGDVVAEIRRALR
jgi:hypothetical protein